MQNLRRESILLCPRNDEESLMILKIADKLGLSVLESLQPHGARLEKEDDLVSRLQETNPDSMKLVIVEIPGPNMEKELEKLGYEIVVIDHHTYDDLDRMNQKSSIEQFLELYEVDDMLLKALGFDPQMVEAVGAIDRGFLWELETLGWNEALKAKGRKFYRSLTLELGPERRKKEEEAARAAWENREEKDGYLVVRSQGDDVSVRDALSFIVADEIGKPTSMIVTQGTRRVYVQETDETDKLKKVFGGFTFGRNRCWGILKDDGDLPSVEEVLKVLKGK